jgi:hypothetical protein
MNKFFSILFLGFIFNGSVLADSWQYSEKKDEFEGSTSKRATVKADNTVDLPFPYNAAPISGFLTIAKTSKGNLGVIVGVTNGQLICDFGNCQIKAKFDDNAPKTFNVSQSNASKNKAFIMQSGDVASFMDAIKTSKQTVFRLQFYQEGYKDT